MCLFQCTNRIQLTFSQASQIEGVRPEALPSGSSRPETLFRPSGAPRTVVSSPPLHLLVAPPVVSTPVQIFASRVMPPIVFPMLCLRLCLVPVPVVVLVAPGLPSTLLLLAPLLPTVRLGGLVLRLLGRIVVPNKVRLLGGASRDVDGIGLIDDRGAAGKCCGVVVDEGGRRLDASRRVFSVGAGSVVGCLVFEQVILQRNSNKERVSYLVPRPPQR